MTSFRLTPEQAKKLSTAEQYEWFRRATSRRNLLRGGIAGAGALAAGTVLGGTANAATTAASTGPTLFTPTGPSAGVTTAPFGQHIAFGQNPASSIAVGWQVRDAVSNPYLRIAEAPGQWGEKLSADVRALATLKGDTSPIDSVPLVNPSTIEQYYLHVAISKLRPGATYYYTLGHDGWNSRETFGSFTTAPTGRVPFRFTAFGARASPMTRGRRDRHLFRGPVHRLQPPGGRQRPASHPGGTSKLTVRGLNEDGQELDNFTLARKSRLF